MKALFIPTVIEFHNVLCLNSANPAVDHFEGETPGLRGNFSNETGVAILSTISLTIDEAKELQTLVQKIATRAIESLQPAAPITHAVSTSP